MNCVYVLNDGCRMYSEVIGVYSTYMTAKQINIFAKATAIMQSTPKTADRSNM